ncbi:hypothetical protein CMUS01_04407 [Colletotrichum musicola]|uniref:Uncharacterized protein n=1 Tax=Colletotrichum musicola TaxID=2175873 RepID=A0A8H6NN71_9PEZI|nr:hypothetical protein CMUS01_04407 [Colletotrichum musicola]
MKACSVAAVWTMPGELDRLRDLMPGNQGPGRQVEVHAVAGNMFQLLIRVLVWELHNTTYPYVRAFNIDSVDPAAEDERFKQTISRPKAVAMGSDFARQIPQGGTDLSVHWEEGRVAFGIKIRDRDLGVLATDAGPVKVARASQSNPSCPKCIVGLEKEIIILTEGFGEEGVILTTSKQLSPVQLVAGKMPCFQ